MGEETWKKLSPFSSKKYLQSSIYRNKTYNRSAMIKLLFLLTTPILASQKLLEVQESLASEELCDMTLPGSICLFDGKKVLLPDSSPIGLSGRWTFDEIKPVDSSGNERHATFTVGAAPGVMGRGASGRLQVSMLCVFLTIKVHCYRRKKMVISPFLFGCICHKIQLN